MGWTGIVTADKLMLEFWKQVKMERAGLELQLSEFGIYDDS